MASARLATWRKRVSNIGALSRACVNTLRALRGDNQVQHIFEREAVPRIEREQACVIDRGGLNLEIEVLAKLLANREAEPTIKANSERRVDDDLRAAEAIEEALDHDVALVGHDAQRGDAAANIVDRLARGTFVEQAFGFEERRASASPRHCARRLATSRRRSRLLRRESI